MSRGKPDRSNPNRWDPAANEIFLNAIDIENDAGRREYLRQQCGDNETLRDEVESLLEAHRSARGPLDRPFAEPRQTTPFAPATQHLDEVVGQYRLRGIIAEGGMGIVYEAEQQGPVRRTVALKIIKPGMDSCEVISRFETERQTLALMDHPNIARVLDAGSTDSHQPYFVMELVCGTPITAHCDEYRLTIRQRLSLFMQVCQAVQHAHQKGIIHRDIKPSNVLVTHKDGVSVPKVIDFGVAKALDQQLTEQSHQTRFTQMVGTPLYMSPEQAALNSIDVDTRSDIYSLGVLLYELLTGTTPCQLERLENASYAEFRRIKCEENPPRPSARIGDIPDQVTVVCERRGTQPGRLGSMLRGELDWIVMKALEKDRQRRFQTARGFAADVKRYLDNEPVEAGPPSATYRVRKFINRHRGLFAASSLVVITLLLGTCVSVWQAIRATNAEHLATKRLWIANEALARVEQANEESKRNRAQALTSNGAFLTVVKKYDLALQQYQAAVEVAPNSPHVNNNFAWFLVTCPDRHVSRSPVCHPTRVQSRGAGPRRGDVLEHAGGLPLPCRQLGGITQRTGAVQSVSRRCLRGLQRHVHGHGALAAGPA